ncbi:MAG: hypothetical protein ACYSVY_18895, partial [Planctomycetota bacterium]
SVARRSGHRLALAILFASVAGTLAVGALAGAIVSLNYWGYCFSRPGVDSRVEGFRKVARMSFVSTERQSSGQNHFVHDLKESISKTMREGQRDPYYNLESRILFSLAERDLLPDEAQPIDSERLASLYSLLEKTVALEIGESGYPWAKRLEGIVVEAEGPGQQQFLFVGVRGGEVSNDHYPYYEVLYSLPEGDGEPVRVSSKRFYFDLAGMEGWEWPLMFKTFSLCGSVPIGLCAFMVGVAVVKKRHQRSLGGAHEVP